MSKGAHLAARRGKIVVTVGFAAFHSKKESSVLTSTAAAKWLSTLDRLVLQAPKVLTQFGNLGLPVSNV